MQREDEKDTETPTRERMYRQQQEKRRLKGEGISCARVSPQSKRRVKVKEN